MHAAAAAAPQRTQSPPQSPHTAARDITQRIPPQLSSLLQQLLRYAVTPLHGEQAQLALTAALGLASVGATPRTSRMPTLLSPQALAAALPFDTLLRIVLTPLERVAESEAALHARLEDDARPRIALALLTLLCSCGAATVHTPVATVTQALLHLLAQIAHATTAANTSQAVAAPPAAGTTGQQRPGSQPVASDLSSGTTVQLLLGDTAASSQVSNLQLDSALGQSGQWRRPDLIELGNVQHQPPLPAGYLVSGARSHVAQMRHNARAALAAVLDGAPREAALFAEVLRAERAALFVPLRSFAALKAPGAHSVCARLQHCGHHRVVSSSLPTLHACSQPHASKLYSSNTSCQAHMSSWPKITQDV